MITVVNKRDTTQPAQGVTRFYIGRGSVLGNPYTSIQDRPTMAEHVCASREESIALFKAWLTANIDGSIVKNHKESDVAPILEKRRRMRLDMLNSIYLAAKQGDVELECYCAPLACHGDVIKELIESKLLR